MSPVKKTTNREKLIGPPFQNTYPAGRYIFRKRMQMDRNVNFRIKLTVAVYKEKKLAYRNDMVVPTLYVRRSEARAHIKKEIRERLRNSNFFISPRVDFDLVRYTQEASCNTYLRYRILEEEARAVSPMAALPAPENHPSENTV